jgi:hypothetical protein
MKIYGNKEEFAITYTPDIEKYATDIDVIQNPDEYLLGGSICFWVKGKNLFAFRDWGLEATYGYHTLHYLVDFLSEYLVCHLSDTPYPVKTKSINAIDMFEETALVKSNVEDEFQAFIDVDYSNVDMELHRRIHAWMQPRSFLFHNGGTFLPDLMVRRVGDKIELSWNTIHPHSNGEHEFYMLHTKGADYIDAKLYRDVVIEFCLEYCNHIQEKEPELTDRYRKNLEKAMEVNL